MDVSFENGFESLSRFYDAFRRATGQAPGDYRKRMGPRVRAISSSQTQAGSDYFHVWR